MKNTILKSATEVKKEKKWVFLVLLSDSDAGKKGLSLRDKTCCFPKSVGIYGILPVSFHKKAKARPKLVIPKKRNQH
jgi:hypothetical protein